MSAKALASVLPRLLVRMTCAIGTRIPPRLTARLKKSFLCFGVQKRCRSLEAEIVKVTCDIDHLEACIRLFNPDTSLAAFKAYIVQHRAKKGTLKRFLMGTLRDAPAPLTSAQLTDLWLEHRGLQVTGETHTVMKRRIGASLISLRAAGTLRNEGEIDGRKGWRVS